jgi:hypothetical protein
MMQRQCSPNDFFSLRNTKSEQRGGRVHAVEEAQVTGKPQIKASQLSPTFYLTSKPTNVTSF